MAGQGALQCLSELQTLRVSMCIQDQAPAGPLMCDFPPNPCPKPLEKTSQCDNGAQSHQEHRDGSGDTGEDDSEPGAGCAPSQCHGVPRPGWKPTSQRCRMRRRGCGVTGLSCPAGTQHSKVRLSTQPQTPNPHGCHLATHSARGVPLPRRGAGSGCRAGAGAAAEAGGDGGAAESAEGTRGAMRGAAAGARGHAVRIPAPGHPPSPSRPYPCP